MHFIHPMSEISLHKIINNTNVLGVQKKRKEQHTHTHTQISSHPVHLQNKHLQCNPGSVKGRVQNVNSLFVPSATQDPMNAHLKQKLLHKKSQASHMLTHLAQ